MTFPHEGAERQLTERTIEPPLRLRSSGGGLFQHRPGSSNGELHCHVVCAKPCSHGRNLLLPHVLVRCPHLSVCNPAGRAISAESTQMKFIQRMNEQPSSWLLLFGTIAILGYLVYLVGNGMTW